MCSNVVAGVIFGCNRSRFLLYYISLSAIIDQSKYVLTIKTENPCAPGNFGFKYRT